MKHFATRQFWEAYQRLPEPVRKVADGNFERLKTNPSHPSLHFKQADRYWSVRVGLHYRALAVRDGGDLVWFWIGTHSEYDRLLK